MSRLPFITLREWTTDELRGATLSDADRKLAEALKNRVIIDELRTGIRIRARSWVGVVQFETFTLRVIPKLAGDHLGLVEMLAYTSGLDALRRHKGISQLDAEKATTLLDLIALLFSQQCDQIVKQGLLQDYRTHEETLQVLRGRLLIDEQMLRHFGRVDRLACRYDERSADVVENQILGAALSVLRYRVQHPGVRQHVLRLHHFFRGICAIGSLDLHAAHQRLTYHRLNARYQEAHELAWLILEGLSIQDLMSVGWVKSFSFLLDMNQLFERFVEKLIRQLFASSPLRVHSQRRDTSILWNVTRNRSHAGVIPDLLMDHPINAGQRLVIDAKYKRYDDRRISNADIYQTFLYAYAFHDKASDIPKALLFYPASQPSLRSTRLRVRTKRGTSSAEIEALSLPIPDVLAELRGSQPLDLCRRLTQRIHASIGDQDDQLS